MRSVEFLRLDEKTIALKMDVYDRHITVKAAFGAYARERLVLPRDIEYNAILQGNDNITQAFCYAWEDDNTLKITHSVVNSLSIDYYTFVFDKNGVRVDISANAYYDGLQEESFLSIP